MQRLMMRLMMNWFLPLVLWVGLMWNLAATAEASESIGTIRTETADTMSTSGDLYDPNALPRKVRKVLFRASVYGKRGEPATAVDMLVAHLSEHPDQDHPLLRLHLAGNLADLDLKLEAAEQYRRAVEMEPRLDRAWFGLADAAYALEDYPTAADAFEQGYRVSPERPAEVLYYAGAAWLMGNEPARAFDDFRQLLEERSGTPQMKWFQGLVVAAARMEQPQRADAAVEQMLIAFADDPQAWYLKYQHEAGKRDWESAAIALRMVGYLRPLSDPENKQLGDLLLVLGVPYLASRSYEAAIGDEGSTEDFERLGSALVAAHEFDRALGVLDDALQSDSSPRLWSLLGDIHYMRQDYDAARSAFQRIADQDETGRAWLMQGYCALELGEKGAAMDCLGRATTFPEQVDMAQLLLQRAMRL